MTIHLVTQGSPEWHALRCGRVTGSRLADICRKIKSGGFSADRANYKAELILERLTGRPCDGAFVSQDMINGTLREPDARVEYELRNRCSVEQVGFVEHPSIPMTGASVDGFVGDDGFVEFKSPKAATHLTYLRSGVVPADYVPQIMWNFACNPSRTWCDFCSYHPDFPETMLLFQVRVRRDDAAIREYEQIVRAFLAELDREVAELRERFVDRKAAA